MASNDHSDKKTKPKDKNLTEIPENDIPKEKAGANKTLMNGRKVSEPLKNQKEGPVSTKDHTGQRRPENSDSETKGSKHLSSKQNKEFENKQTQVKKKKVRIFDEGQTGHGKEVRKENVGDKTVDVSNAEGKHETDEYADNISYDQGETEIREHGSHGDSCYDNGVGEVKQEVREVKPPGKVERAKTIIMVTFFQWGTRGVLIVFTC